MLQNTGTMSQTGPGKLLMQTDKCKVQAIKITFMVCLHSSSVDFNYIKHSQTVYQQKLHIDIKILNCIIITLQFVLTSMKSSWHHKFLPELLLSVVAHKHIQFYFLHASVKEKDLEGNNQGLYSWYCCST